MMCEPPQKIENNAIFRQNYTSTVLIGLLVTYPCCFSLGGNLDFLQKKSFITSNTGRQLPRYLINKFCCRAPKC